MINKEDSTKDINAIKNDLRWLNTSILMFARELYLKDPTLACSATGASLEVLDYISKCDLESIIRTSAVGVSVFGLRNGSDVSFWKDVFSTASENDGVDKFSRTIRAQVKTMLGDNENE